MTAFQKNLRDLLDRLDATAATYPGVSDTGVRDITSLAILDGFCRLKSSYEVPRDFALSSKEASMKVMAVLVTFLDDAIEAARNENLDTFHKRLNAFQDESVVSKEGHDYGWYFGRWEPEDFGVDGVDINGRI